MNGALLAAINSEPVPVPNSPATRVKFLLMANFM